MRTEKETHCKQTKNFKGRYLEAEMGTETVIKCVWMRNWQSIWGKEHKKVKT